VATALRQRQIRVETVRGVDERHDALIRLADALAGFTRHALPDVPTSTRESRFSLAYSHP
ncbi:MAG TPA: hypothetical protein VI542_20725, partial [Candidatus Tectomicrobia bacterium]